MYFGDKKQYWADEVKRLAKRKKNDHDTIFMEYALALMEKNQKAKIDDKRKKLPNDSKKTKAKNCSY